MQSIVRELNNERIDIVPYSSNSELFVTRALAPARVVNIEVDHNETKMTVAVEDEKLSLAIGRNGQNARLASKLTGWKVNIVSETEYNESQHRDAEMLMPIANLDGVGAKLQERLIEIDISSVQRLAQTSVESLVKVEGLGPKSAEKLSERAKAMVAEIEKEYALRKKEEKAEEIEVKKDEEKLTAEDVFEDDENYVTEVDDVPEITAPDFDDDVEEEDVEATVTDDEMPEEETESN